MQWELVELSVAYHELDDCSAMIPECSPGLDYDVLTKMAAAPHEVSYIGSLSDEQPITGVISLKLKELAIQMQRHLERC